MPSPSRRMRLYVDRLSFRTSDIGRKLLRIDWPVPCTGGARLSNGECYPIACHCHASAGTVLHLRRTCRLRDYRRQCPTPSPSWGCCKSRGSRARPRIRLGAGTLGLGGWPMGLGRRPLGTATAATRRLGCASNRYSFASRALALAADSRLSALAEADP